MRASSSLVGGTMPTAAEVQKENNKALLAISRNRLKTEYKQNSIRVIEAYKAEKKSQEGIGYVSLYLRLCDKCGATAGADFGNVHTLGKCKAHECELCFAETRAELCNLLDFRDVKVLICKTCKSSMQKKFMPVYTLGNIKVWQFLLGAMPLTYFGIMWAVGS